MLSLFGWRYCSLGDNFQRFLCTSLRNSFCYHSDSSHNPPQPQRCWTLPGLLWIAKELGRSVCGLCRDRRKMGVKKGGGQETDITCSRPKQSTWGDGRIDWQERQARLTPVPMLVRWGEVMPGCFSHVGCFLCFHPSSCLGAFRS